MILRSLVHEGETWTVCSRVASDSPGAAGLEFVFVRDAARGGDARYAWPVEGEVLRALYEEATELGDDILIELLGRAIGAQRTVNEPGSD